MVRRVAADWILPLSAPPRRDATLVLDADGRVLGIEDGRAGADQSIAGVVLPALVNAHVHLELSALRDRAPGGQGFLPWVIGMLAERDRLGQPALRAATLEATAELLRYGTAAVGEVTNTLEAVPALSAAGLRGIVFHELLERDELAQGGALAHARAARAALEKTTPWPPGLGYAVAPHAPYSTGPDLILRAVRAAQPLPSTIHLAEDPAELELLLGGTGPWPRILGAMGVWERCAWVPGRSPVAHLDALGVLASRPPPLLVHLVHASAADLALVRQRGAPVVLCPRSNLHIGGRLPDVPAMVRAGLPLCLGTDSLASNATLSIFSEMAALARAFPGLEPQALVAWATLGGARALGLGEELGALTAGRRPGVIAVSGPAGDDPFRFLALCEPEEVTWLSRA